MLNINRATLVGHAGRDPEMRDLKNGGKAATFTLATTEKWTDREGRPGEATEWHRVVVYGPVVEAVGKMLKKGDRVMVEGRIATRGFTDREGNDRTVTEIVVSGWQGMVNILGGRRAADETPDAVAGGGSAPESPA
ncbi:MAG: single-stranded DNA-binding protein [Alphaproteobacteria bacterium]|nr:single-stranded DNA-binding protein [Alphaproteobacteria bacterium]